MREQDKITSINLLRAVLSGYDDISNILHLAHAVELQLQAAEMSDLDQYAMEETLGALNAIALSLKARIETGNRLDIDALLGGKAPA